MCKSLVSICIPTFNGEQFIVEAIDSAITQTYSNLEIVVSDDASNDNTLKLVEQFKSKTNIPINIFHHLPNGIGANWNNCIKHSKGEYIKFLFQDDVLLPTCVEEMVSVLEKNKKIGLVASKREIMVDDSYEISVTNNWIENYGDLQKTINLTYKGSLGIIDARFFKSDELLKRPMNKIGEPTTYLFRKEIINEIGFFREDLFQILDYEFCCRVLRKSKIGILNIKLVKFRLHKNQASMMNQAISGKEEFLLKKLLYEDYFWYLNSNSKIELIKSFSNFVKKYRLFKRIFKNKMSWL